MNNAKPTLFKIEHLNKSFKKADGQDLLVLDDINFEMQEGEIIALLGKSGSGKSTLLRILAGLMPASDGRVSYRGQKVTQPVQGISMVFQSFALLPWLTVLQNVELGLEAQGVSRKERRKRALKAIDTIGLDGFESAYPKELSGGMRQRVGFARALVVEPELLLMDEPFSALDVLTAENLRGDLIDLWTKTDTKIKGIFFVTHNIEEAALMADRVIIFNHDPGRIRADLKVSSPLPRDSQDAHFRKLIDDIYTLMTTSEPETVRTTIQAPQFKDLDLFYRLPDAGISELTGLLDEIVHYGSEHNLQGAIDLPVLSDELNMDSDTLFPLTEALEVLRFAKISKGDIMITDIGRAFVEADILMRKQMFAKQLIAHVPLAQFIRQTLDEREHNKESENHFLERLQENLTEGEAERILKIIIDWGRYAELFAFDYDSGNFSLENPK